MSHELRPLPSFSLYKFQLSNADQQQFSVVLPLRRSTDRKSSFFLSFQPFKAYWLSDAPAGLKFSNFTLCQHCIYVFCIYLRTNSDFCFIQNKLIGFYNRKEKCLQRGTAWDFKRSGLRFVFKSLTLNLSVDNSIFVWISQPQRPYFSWHIYSRMLLILES
jgi:hypothetical protein